MRNLLLLGMALASLAASAGTLLPDNAANSWHYETSFDQSRLDVTIDAVDGHWKRYSSFFGLQDQWVWNAPGYDEIFLFDGRFAELLCDTSAAIGTRYGTSVGGADFVEIAARGSLATVSDTYETLTLNFGNTTPTKPQLRSVTLAQGVGIVSWTYQNPVDGLSTYRLLHAMIDGRFKDMAEAPKFKSGKLECSFNRLASQIGEAASCGVKCTFVNDGDLPFTFRFTSGQSFEITLMEANGRVVRRWSDGRVFTQALWSHTVAAGDSWTFGDYLPMAYADGHPLETGTYTVLIEMGGFSASAAYEVTVD